jgi:RimJ/RimL family protein N-acetyltransferase
MDDAIRLRPVEPADLEAFFAQQSDPVAWRMVAFPSKEPRDRPAFDAHWKKIQADPAIVVRTITRGGRVVGNAVCFPLGTERQVGYWVAREEWGRGIATAALQELLLLVPERPLHARCAKDNVASVRTLRRAGFVVCREERALSLARGGEIDELFWVLEAPRTPS